LLGIWSRKFQRSKGFVKTEQKLSERLNRADREQSDFGSLNEVTSMVRCLSGSSDSVAVGGPLVKVTFVVGSSARGVTV
jgi:hypothetical protein